MALAALSRVRMIAAAASPKGAASCSMEARSAEHLKSGMEGMGIYCSVFKGHKTLLLWTESLMIHIAGRYIASVVLQSRTHWEQLRPSQTYLANKRGAFSSEKIARVSARAMASSASGRRQVPNPHMTEVHLGIRRSCR